MTHPMIEEAARAMLLRNGFTGAEIDTIQRINSKRWQDACADALVSCRIAIKACAENCLHNDDADRLRALSEQIGAE